MREAGPGEGEAEGGQRPAGEDAGARARPPGRASRRRPCGSRTPPRPGRRRRRCPREARGARGAPRAGEAGRAGGAGRPEARLRGATAHAPVPRGGRRSGRTSRRSPGADRPYAPKRPFDACRPCPAGVPGASTSATVTEAIAGTRASRVRAPARGSGWSAARRSAAAPSKGRPVRSPRRWRKKSRASIEPSVQDRAVVIAARRHQAAGAEADGGEAGARSGGRVGAGHGDREVDGGGERGDAPGQPQGRAGGGVRVAPSRSRGCTAAGSRCRPTPAATRRRRSWTAGWAPRARRRASTRPGLPSRRPAGRWTRVHAPAVEQRDRAVGEGRGLRVVGGEDDRDAVRAGRRGERAQDVGAVGAVQRGGGLVGEEDRAGAGPGRGRWRRAAARPGAVRAGACGRSRRRRGAPATPGRRSWRAGGRCRAASAGRAAFSQAFSSGTSTRGRVDPAEAVAAQPLAGQRAHGVHGRAVEPDLAAAGAAAGRTGSCSSVVLPLPRGPLTARISPSRTPSETPLSAGEPSVL